MQETEGARGAVSRIRPGLVLADSRHESRADAYLQRRLVLFYGVTLGIALALYVADSVLHVVAGDWGIGLVLDPARVVHLGAALLTGSVLGLLRRRSLRGRWLLFRDAFGLYVVGYFLLTGKGLFDASSALEIIGHHLHTPPVPPRNRVPAVPVDLEAVILRCIAKEPSERFADAGSLGDALARCADAGRWTEAEAAAWWRGHANGSTATALPQ